ncbi:N-terminal acetyltransferase A complex auxiliary subunit NAA15-like [Humulus lupulus]|uniref:N-terminal acetyltransferase A complex auxiliary subunit NAA15-like n=1 Tax=Humulus lupulus TaxID=3486 RepID=UPI002B4144D9|nr:N-terminal acetyltransferase A complex auxiliary subunit NAA15-like [Humulus lupulus]
MKAFTSVLGSIMKMVSIHPTKLNSWIRCTILLGSNTLGLLLLSDLNFNFAAFLLYESQKKKMRQKLRKAEARAKKEAEGKNEESNANSVSKTGKRNVKPVDPDPHGEKLLQVEDPLLEATKYLKLLQKNSPDSLETHLLSFEVNVRKQKVLLAFQAVKQLLRLNAEHPDTHRCLVCISVIYGHRVCICS